LDKALDGLTFSFRIKDRSNIHPAKCTSGTNDKANANDNIDIDNDDIQEKVLISKVALNGR